MRDNLWLRFAIIVSLVSVLIPAAATAQPWMLSKVSDQPSAPAFSLVGLFLEPSSPAHYPDRAYWEARRSDWAEALERAAARARQQARERARQRAAAQAAVQARAAWVAPAPTYSGSGRADWYAIAQCESGGRWDINTSNGFWGGLQFLPSTWFGYGGGPFDGKGPFPYSAAAQIAVAERVLAGQGPGAWPNCFHWA
ncbi:MAG: transglycosylase family protein [Actinomycetota bacterium]